MGNDTLIKDFKELKNKYEGLFLLNNENKIIGRISFLDNVSGLLCEYDIEILIPKKYPNKIPTVKEISGKILHTFHTNGDGTLCLGSNLDVRHKFSTKPTLLGFVEYLVEPYLFAHTYFKKYEKMPFGELNHGANGVLQYYNSLFEVNDYETVMKILHFLCKYGFRGHHKCCCGSEKKFRDCHGYIIKNKGINIKRFREIIIKDYFLCLSIAPHKCPELGNVSNMVLSTLGKMRVSELFDCNISKDEKILVFNTILKMLSETEAKSTGRKKQYLKMLIYSINDKCNILKSNLIN